MYDGVCSFCNETVQFILKRDPAGVFHFAALQGAKARALLGTLPVPRDSARDPSTLILIEWGQVYFKTDAVLRIARHLTGGWSCLYLLLIVPRVLRDQVYDWFAVHRYQWFGKLESCPIPDPAVRERFLDL